MSQMMGGKKWADMMNQGKADPKGAMAAAKGEGLNEVTPDTLGNNSERSITEGSDTVNVTLTSKR
jgi:hypothetical protein